MTKAKARARAKAKASQKIKKRDAAAEQPSQPRPGQFDPGPGTIQSPRHNANPTAVGAGRPGSSRSR